jgi:hypothetical protein
LDAEAIIAAFREPVRTFAECADKFIAGAGGLYDPWTPPDAEDTAGGGKDTAAADKAAAVKTVAAKSAANKDRGLKPVSPEQVEQQFADYLERLLGLAVNVPGGKKDPVNKYLGGIAGQLAEQKALAVFALGYGTLSILRSVIGKGSSGADAVSLANHWRLDRKLREVFRTFGVEEYSAAHIVTLIWAFLARTNNGKTGAYKNAGDGKALALAIILENYDTEDFRRLLGINRFEEITWFNKESFEQALFYGCFFGLLEEASVLGAGAASGAALKWPDRARHIAELYAALIAAEEKSEYQVEALLAALSAKKVSVTIAAKKAAIKKETTKTVKKAAVKKPPVKKAKLKDAKAAPKAKKAPVIKKTPVVKKTSVKSVKKAPAAKKAAKTVKKAPAAIKKAAKTVKTAPKTKNVVKTTKKPVVKATKKKAGGTKKAKGKGKYRG